MGSEQRFLTPLCQAPLAPVAPRVPVENQGRLDFEQLYRENATFARKMTSNFQQHPEDATRSPKAPQRTPKDGHREPGAPQGAQGRAKGSPKWSQGITPRIVQVDILAKVLSSQELPKKSSLGERWGAMQHIFLHRISMRVLLA